MTTFIHQKAFKTPINIPWLTKVNPQDIPEDEVLAEYSALEDSEKDEDEDSEPPEPETPTSTVVPVKK